VTEKHEHLLGNVLYEMAVRRGVRGPYNVSKHVQQETGQGPSSSAWSQIFTGTTHRPKQDALLAFAKAFKLSPEELQRLAHVYTFDKELPEGVDIHPDYTALAAKLGWTASRPEEPAPDVEAHTSATEGPSEWVGERVRALLEADEEVQGTLLDATEHGVVIDVRARRQQGPCFYSWKLIRWMYPVDRQTVG
jgi:hypothetical protein